MTRSRRTRILVRGSAALRADMARAVLSGHTVSQIAPPTEGLVMLTLRETARESLFHMGELLVTEAKARIGETMGLGIIAGSRADAAWELAVIDAALNARLPVTLGWDALLEEEEGRLRLKQEEEDGRILGTRVSFESMEET